MFIRWHAVCHKYICVLNVECLNNQKKMRKSLLVIVILSAGFFLLGEGPASPVTIVVPTGTDTVAYDQALLLVVSASKESSPTLLVSTQWQKVQLFDLRADKSKETFAKDFYNLFGPKMTVQLLTYSFKLFKGYTLPDTILFTYSDTMNIRMLWKRPEFMKMYKKIQQSTDADAILVNMRGWNDSSYTTVYDDPNADGRLYYKLNLQLIPGRNDLYLAPNGERRYSLSYPVTFVREYKPTTDRTSLFHNSSIEQSCTPCHEGLPSADNGASMKADCTVCHKAIAGATYLHSPVEMKECSSCHSWSKEKHAVVVEKGVPTVCYDCHTDKQAQVDSSTSIHPVAGDCLTCHSPHGSEQNHILKESVYPTCTSCHEDQQLNHPVGRHPLRFVKLKNGDEISCASCHNPHGSNNNHLLRFAGEGMEVCAQCH